MSCFLMIVRSMDEIEEEGELTEQDIIGIVNEGLPNTINSVG